MRLLLSWIAAAILFCAAAAPAHAEWHEARSKHFIIYADQHPKQLHAYAERLERFDRALRYIRGMDDPPLTDSNKLTIYVLKDDQAVAKLAGSRWVAGFYAPRASGAVAFVPRRVGTAFDTSDFTSESVFFHEYAHHLQLQYSSSALPPWVIEGFAEFFSTARVDRDGSVLIGAPPLHRGRSIFNRASLPLTEMLAGSDGRDDDRQRDVLYGRGWLLTHYLTFADNRKGQFTRYLEGIQNGRTAAESAAAAFGDVVALDRELDRYGRKSLLGVRIDGSVLPIGPVEVRQLTAGEAAIMDVRIRSKRGVDRRTAPRVAADARKAAGHYPNDPFVQATLAETEYDAGNFAAAEAAADRALAVNPNYVHALVYKGRAQMALALENPQAADWQKVRSWFSRANKADTENAEPLMLFHQTYHLAGEQPTRNAVKALLYSVVLAPQDKGLRLAAVQQLLVDEDFAGAKAMLAPIAFQPHAGGEWRQWTMKIMEAIGTGNADAALALMRSGEGEPEEDASGS